jgi:molecular chaperone HtpG
LDEYKEKIATLQTDKENKVVALYTNDAEAQYGFVKAAKDRSYDVIALDGPLVPHWVSKMEQDQGDLTFARVDSDTLDNLIKKDEEIPSKLSKDEEEKLKVIFEGAVNKEKFKVEFASMSETEAPIIVTQPEFIRRMMEQQKMGGAGFFGAFPESYQLVVNSNHPKVGAILGDKDEQVQADKVKQLTDLAMLSQGMLKGEALSKFIERSIELV